MTIFRNNVELSEKQTEVLKALPNSIITGSAGTGKTLLAALIAIQFFKQKNSVCLIVYTKALSYFIERYLEGYSIDVYYEYEWFSKGPKKYDIIIIDEFQDFSIHSINEIREYSNNGIFLFGDIEQKIYKNDIQNNRSTITETELNELIHCDFKIFELDENYRIPNEKVSLINHIFNENHETRQKEIENFNKTPKTTGLGLNSINTSGLMLHQPIFEEKSIKTNSKVSDRAIIKYFENEKLEIEWLTQYISNSNYKNIGILFPTNSKKISILSNKLNESGVKNGFKDKYYNTISFQNAKNINLMTIHSSKGLEFDCVILPFFIFDNLYHISLFEKSFNIYYVALTRTSNQLVITYTDFACDIISKLKGFSDDFEIIDCDDKLIYY